MQQRYSKTHTGFTAIESLLIIVIVVVVGFAGYYVWGSKDKPQQTNTTPSSTSKSDSVSFTGTVTAVNNGCHADGNCSVIVGERVIATGSGLTANAVDNVWGTTDPALKAGDNVTVKALQNGQEYTLQRCKDCYIRKAPQ